MNWLWSCKETVKMRINALIFLFITCAYSAHSLANETLDIIKSSIDSALEASRKEHENWLKAEELLKPLLAKNDPGAKYYASYLYNYGGAHYPKDEMKAEKLALEAAEAGFVPAMLDQGVRHEYGLSGKVDYSASVSWYIKAATAGSQSAAGRLLKAYSNGELDLPIDPALVEKYREIRGQCSKP